MIDDIEQRAREIVNRIVRDDGLPHWRREAIDEVRADIAAALRAEREKALEEGRTEILRTLASALAKFAPDLALDLRQRHKRAESALDELLIVMRTNAAERPKPTEAGDD